MLLKLVKRVEVYHRWHFIMLWLDSSTSSRCSQLTVIRGLWSVWISACAKPEVWNFIGIQMHDFACAFFVLTTHNAELHFSPLSYFYVSATRWWKFMILSLSIKFGWFRNLVERYNSIQNEWKVFHSFFSGFFTCFTHLKAKHIKLIPCILCS